MSTEQKTGDHKPDIIVVNTEIPIFTREPKESPYYIIYINKDYQLICDEYDKEEEAKAMYLHLSTEVLPERGPIVIKGFKAEPEIVAKFIF